MLSDAKESVLLSEPRAVPIRSDGHSGWPKLLYFFTMLAVFGLLTSQQRNFDGPLQDIARVTKGQIDAGARHPLYTVIGVPLYRLLRSLGYLGDAGFPLLMVNAVCAALGCTALLAAFEKIFWRRGLALLLALAYALSYGHWYFAEDAFYNVFTYLPTLMALLLLFTMTTRSERGSRPLDALRLAGLLTVAILGTQEHALFALVVACGLLMAPPQVELCARLKVSARYVLFLAVLTGGAYILLATLLAGCRNASCIVSWLRPYGELIPMYGRFSPDRLLAAAWSLLAAIVPIWRGMALRQLQHGIITPAKLLPQLSLALTVAALVAVAVILIIRWKRVWREFRYPLFLALLWLIIYTPPIIWLDPYGPERWIIPLIAVLILIGIATSVLVAEMPLPGRRWVAAVGVTALSVIAVANLTQAILPDHRIRNPDIAMARYASEQMKAEDIIISPRWDWTLYLESYGRTAISLPAFALEVAGRQLDRGILLDRLEERLVQARGRGGRAFLVDLSAYSPDDWAWITQNTGLRPDDFTRFSLEAAWEFEDKRVSLIR